MKAENFWTHWKHHAGMSWLWIDRRYRDVEPWWKFRVGGRLAEAWYYLKCRLWHKYSTVTPRTLWPTWCDGDTRLIHVMFQILVDVVEGEDWFNNRAYYLKADEEVYDWDGRDAFQEVAILYDWWTRRRQQRLDMGAAALTAWHNHFQSMGGMTFQATEDPNLSQAVFPEDRPETKAADLAKNKRLHEILRELEVGGDQEDEDMMIRLIKIRGYLWT